MAVTDVTREGVELALREFRRIGLEAMLAKYGGRPSTRWYVKVEHHHFDQKVLLRAAHRRQHLGELPPHGPGRLHAQQARRHFTALGYLVVEKFRATPENLARPEATGPLMNWLIGAARQRTTMTYGQAAIRLEQECGFGSVFPRDMGQAVGAMQRVILRRVTTAPLLHVLLVRTDTGEPGDGAAEFLADRFPHRPRLREDDVRVNHPELWTEVVGLAAEEVYAYPRWEQLYRRLHGTYTPDPFFLTPAEADGTPRGGVGEGPNHKALRLWIKRNPDRVDRRFRGARAETEEELLSGDRVDVVYYTDSEVLAIEVKSRDSNWADLRRGIYQCVKYQAVLSAQEEEGRSVRSLLVTEFPLPLNLVDAASRLGVCHRRVILPHR